MIKVTIESFVDGPVGGPPIIEEKTLFTQTFNHLNVRRAVIAINEVSLNEARYLARDVRDGIIKKTPPVKT